MVESEQLRAKNRDIGIDSKWEESVDKSKIPDLIIGDRNLSMSTSLSAWGWKWDYPYYHHRIEIVRPMHVFQQTAQ